MAAPTRVTGSPRSGAAPHDLSGRGDVAAKASAVLGVALASAGTSAVKAVRDHVRDKKAKVDDATLQVEEN